MSTTDVESEAQFAPVTFASVLFLVDPNAVVPTHLVITENQMSARMGQNGTRSLGVTRGFRMETSEVMQAPHAALGRQAH